METKHKVRIMKTMGITSEKDVDAVIEALQRTVPVRPMGDKNTLPAKLEQVRILGNQLLSDVDGRLQLFSQMGYSLPDQVTGDLHARTKRAITQVVDLYVTEYERMAGLKPGLKQLYVQEWDCVLYYYYQEAEEATHEVPGQKEQITLVAGFVKGQDLMAIMPAHVIEDWCDTISDHEHSNS